MTKLTPDSDGIPSDMSSEPHKDESRSGAIRRIRKQQNLPEAVTLAGAIISGEKGALARAITLSESTHPVHRQLAAQVIEKCLPHAGKSLRIGITGVPGVGKSTFIESFGTSLTSAGKRVAVLAIDPTSPFSRGSILGDKTRMEKLSIDPMAYIRPSPSSLNPGGVARHTRESIILCEAAGFDIIIVETVGVGQGETTVWGMTDFFLLLMLAGAGDQLQGIKRGIMELCDALIITKSDGANKDIAQRAKADYTSALHLFPPRESGWVPRVDQVSALQGEGIDRVWNIISSHAEWMKSRHLFEENRQRQDVEWLHDSIRNELATRILGRPDVTEYTRECEMLVKSGQISPFRAAESVIEKALAR